jgi:CRISPR-associated exonuclease Cas4
MTFSESRVLLTASMLVEYWYCPRFTYYMEVLGIRQYEEKRLKVQLGRDVHRKKSLRPEYLRKNIGVISQEKEVYLSDSSLGICGILDEILFFQDGKLATLDYKFAYNKHKFKTQFLQNVFYSLLLESHYRVRPDFCYIVYTRENNKLVKYEITGRDRDSVLSAIREVRRIISRGIFPKATSAKSRCGDCTYRKICVQ